jgi:LCP family protein required for cell wall assembly
MMSSDPPRQTVLPQSRRRARRRRTLRRVLFGIGFVLLVGLGFAAFQGWQIVDAIFHAEKAAVVPLPTRSSTWEIGGATGNTSSRPQIVPITAEERAATAEAAASVEPDQPTHAAMPNVTVVATATQAVEIAAVSSPTPPATSTVAPTMTVTATEPADPTAQPTEAVPTSIPTATLEGMASDSAAVISATETPTVVTTATAESTVESETPTAIASGDTASNDDGSSRFDIFQQLVGAGLDDGDPGLNEAWGGAETINILVVGVDRRPEGGDQNSDVIIIAQLDLIDKELRGVSIPRDLLVEIPGIGFDKINSAYNYGVVANPDDPAAGVSMLRDTIEYNFGIPIDHYVMIDFDGFVKVVDSVGGIEVFVPEDLYDPEYPTIDYGTEEIFFPAGMNQMDGETALKYVRTRHQDSDDGRRERQIDVILAILEKGKSLGSISRIDDLIFALGDSAQTSLDLEQQLLLARLALQMDESNITLQTLAPPLIWAGTLETTGAWVYTGDWGPIVAFVQEAVFGPAGSETPEVDAAPQNTGSGS